MSSIEIQVQGQDESQTGSYSLEAGTTVRIGRKPADGWTIGWERQMSREHADIRWDGKELHVQCVAGAKNPFFFERRPVRECVVMVGDEFTIGGTRFSVGRAVAPGGVDAAMLSVASGVMETIFSSEQLSQVPFGNTERQLETLARLPRLISSAQSDDDLATRLAGLLLSLIPQSMGAAVVRMDPDQLQVGASAKAVIPESALACVETRGNARGAFKPSRRLALKTLNEEKSVIHIWRGDEASQNFTVTEGMDWAFCAPVPGDGCRGWCLYVSGNGTRDGNPLINDEPLQGDLRFTELVAQFIGSVRQVRLLQEHKTKLSTFFSPNVIKNVTGTEAEQAMEPAERDISVLFCDVRGFSMKAEEMSHDLLGLLRSVRGVLSVMANGILDRDGTIADFQGDAALGFWGWPVQLEEGPLPACRAALDIYRVFRDGGQDEASLLHGFAVGLGIAHGMAVAGQVGTQKQAKVGVFGPIVNCGARLEGLTRQLGVPIVIDEATAQWVHRLLPASDGRARPLARVRPKGMREPLTVYALLPSEEEESIGLTGPAVDTYEKALEATTSGRWDEARDLLATLPADDGPTRFLLRQMKMTANVAPDDWDGAFSLARK